MASTCASTKHEKRILEICSSGVSDFNKDELSQLIKVPGVRIDATDENGMTGLMHAAYKGNIDACNMLLRSGADVNSNLHTEGYTALMFATIAGHAKVVSLFLQAGAKIGTTTNAGKTAVQLGAFVGQHACVHVINNYYSLEDLLYYTTPHGVEKAPKLDPSLASPLHALMVSSNLHPVKIILHLRSNPSLLDMQDQVTRVLRILVDRMMEEEREGYSLKLHYIAFVIQQCHRMEGGASGCLKMLLTLQEDGMAIELDKFLRQCLREFPRTHSALLQQMVATLAKVPTGGDPTALSLFYSVILGNKSEEQQESCSTCGEFSSCLKKCSKCKQASYCDVECQKLAWTVGNHKKLCRKWAQKKSEEQSPKLHDDDLLKKEKTTSMESQQSQEGDSSAVGVIEVPTT